MLNAQELERHVVSAVIAWGKRALDEMPLVTVDDFASAPVRDIYAAALELEAEGSTIDLPSLYAHLGLNESARNVTNEISDLDAPMPFEIRKLAGKLRAISALRRATAAAREIVGIPGRNGQSPEGMIAEAVKLARRIIDDTADVASSPTISLREIADAEIEKLERIRAGEPMPETVRTGLSDLDLVLHGFEPGSFVVIAGETSSGKSALCGQIAVAEARHGHAVAFITSEMTHRQMLARIVSGLSGVPVEVLIHPRRAAENGAIEQYRALADLPIEFQRVCPPSLTQAAGTIRYLAAERKIRLAVIDYAQRLASYDEENQERAIGEIAHEAKNLALELGIVVLAAAQVNRNVSSRPDPRPKLADLRGSGRLEQDADAVLFVYQPKRHGQPGNPEIIVAKNRNGKTGPIDVHFHEETCTFHGMQFES